MPANVLFSQSSMEFEQHHFPTQTQFKTESVRLEVTSKPVVGLDIYLNGQKQIQKTPFAFENLPAGVYLVHAKNKYYQSKVRKITLDPGDDRRITLHAEAQFGTLSINARPEAIVTFDYNPISQLENLRLLPQTITLRAECPGFAMLKKVVKIEKQVHRKVELINDKPLGSVKLNINSTEANFTLTDNEKGYYYGTGSTQINKVPQGKYALFVELEGFRDHREILKIHGGKENVYNISLFPFTEAYLKQKNNFKTKRNLAFTGATILITVGTLQYIQNQSLHKNYVETHSSKEALYYRVSLEKRTVINNSIFWTAGTLAVLSIYYQVRYVKIHPKDFLSISLTPINTNLAVEWRF